MTALAALHGFLVMDKPAGLTSRDAVDHVQHWFPRLKLGHAGTLDPAATGVLVIGVGAVATRFIEYVQDQEKTYLTTIRLGATSSTDDADGEITHTPSAVQPAVEEVTAALASFTGQISQTPPAYSAARIEGERAHTRARRGENVILQPRLVTIHEILLLGYQFPELVLLIRCSKGTYIRSIARDLGEKLATGGYVQQLRRTRIGPFSPEQAPPWDSHAEQAQQFLMPLALSASHLPRCDFTSDQARRLRQGQKLPSPLTTQAHHVSLWHDNDFFGIGTLDESGLFIKPSKIICLSGQ